MQLSNDNMEQQTTISTNEIHDTPNTDETDTCTPIYSLSNYHHQPYNNNNINNNNNHDSSSSSILDTLDWARGTAKRRKQNRIKYMQSINQRETKSKLILQQRNDSLSQSIKSGRKALAEAEQHMKQFQEYLQRNSSQSHTVEVSRGGNDYCNTLIEDDHHNRQDDLHEENRIPKTRNDSKGSNHQIHEQESNITSNSVDTKINNNKHTTELFPHKGQPYTEQQKELMEQLIRDGEEIFQRDKIIAAARRQGNQLSNNNNNMEQELQFSRQLLHLFQREGEVTLPNYLSSSSSSVVVPTSSSSPQEYTVSSKEQRRNKKVTTTTPEFDPDTLFAAKRAAIRAEKAKEEKEAADLQQLQKTVFKARPLPGGVTVKNDPYALTSSARGKQVISNKSKTGEGFQDDDGDNDDSISNQLDTHHKVDASYFLNSSMNSDLSHFDKGVDENVNSINGGNHSSPGLLDSFTKKQINPHFKKLQQQQQQQQQEKRGKIYKKITSLVSKDIQPMSFDHESSQDTVINPSDDQDRDDMSSTLTLQQEIAKLQAALYHKRSKCMQTITSLEDVLKDDSPITSDIDDSDSESPTKDRKERPKQNDETSICSIQSRRSLYSRLKNWQDTLEQRKIKAKEMKQLEGIKDITGRPDLNDAKESWIRAKEEHDHLLKIELDRKKEMKERRLKQEQSLEEKKHQELQSLQRNAMMRRKEVQSNVDKSQQLDSSDRLSRPLKPVIINRPKSASVEKVIDNKSNDEGDETIDANPPKDCIESKKTVSFADMDDKEFAKMVKKLEAQSRRRGQKSVLESTIYEKTNENLDDNDVDNVKDYLVNDKSEIDSPSQDPVSESQLNAVLDQKSSFVSSNAQANLLAEIRGADLHEYTIATATSAMDAIEENVKATEMTENIPVVVQEMPYQRYESGKVPFFDKSSSNEKGRFRVLDAKCFATDSMRRKAPREDIFSEGVMLLVGKRSDCDEQSKDVQQEEVITVLFDRSRYSEKAASDWWYQNRHHLISDVR